ncbi:hypothetical protein Zmor_018282 [Zophobas morio]|uniref:Uncharacterized protein n=1 Tax=Zophobas morio TaxID=2755281 RepID=A0AA38IDY8_9CUCU|nr:hypothetical protein Zmor_018282 [Zophobas morio]
MSSCYHCKKTGKTFNCDACKQSLCKECAELTETEIRAFELKNRRMRFYCKKCDGAITLIPQLVALVNSLQTQINELKSNIKANTSNKITSEEEIFAEINDRLHRSKNVIVYNLSEFQSDDLNTRINKDKESVSNILNSMNLPLYEFKSIRLGTAKQNSKPRPLKLIFKNANEAMEVLKDRRKAPNDIKLNYDQTILQREKYKMVRQELQTRLSNGEQNLAIRYIRGEPKIISKSNKKIAIKITRCFIGALKDAVPV